MEISSRCGSLGLRKTSEDSSSRYYRLHEKVSSSASVPQVLGINGDATLVVATLRGTRELILMENFGNLENYLIDNIYLLSFGLGVSDCNQVAVLSWQRRDLNSSLCTIDELYLTLHACKMGILWYAESECPRTLAKLLATTGLQGLFLFQLMNPLANACMKLTDASSFLEDYESMLF